MLTLLMMFDLRRRGGRRTHPGDGLLLPRGRFPRARRRERRAFVPLDGVVPEDGDGGGPRCCTCASPRGAPCHWGSHVSRCQRRARAGTLMLMRRCQPTCALNWNLSAMHASTALGNQPRWRVRPGRRAGSSRWSARWDRLGDDDVEFEGRAVSLRVQEGTREEGAEEGVRRDEDGVQVVHRRVAAGEGRTRHDTARSHARAMELPVVRDEPVAEARGDRGGVGLGGGRGGRRSGRDETPDGRRIRHSQLSHGRRALVVRSTFHLE